MFVGEMCLKWHFLLNSHVNLALVMSHGTVTDSSAFSLYVKDPLMKKVVICICILFSFLSLTLRAEQLNSQGLKIFQFNIWNEANLISDGVNKIADVIAAADADIVAFSEVRNKNGDWHEKIIKMLKDRGLTYYGQYGGGDVGLISRYPVTKTEIIADYTDEDRGSLIAYYIDLGEGKQIVVASAHLDYTQYALNMIRGYQGGENGWDMIDSNGDDQPTPVTDIPKLLEYNKKSYKDETINRFIAFSLQEKFDHTPLFLVGDFNDGSDLDWTENTKDEFGHNGLVIQWPNSISLRDANFVDAYREVYPDELKNPGLTWPSTADISFFSWVYLSIAHSGTPSWTPKSDERDRIDFIYYRPEKYMPVAAYLVGPSEYIKKNEVSVNPGDDPFLLGDMPWPTDHKGVIIDFVRKQ